VGHIAADTIAKAKNRITNNILAALQELDSNPVRAAQATLSQFFTRKIRTGPIDLGGRGGTASWHQLLELSTYGPIEFTQKEARSQKYRNATAMLINESTRDCQSKTDLPLSQAKIHLAAAVEYRRVKPEETKPLKFSQFYDISRRRQKSRFRSRVGRSEAEKADTAPRVGKGLSQPKLETVETALLKSKKFSSLSKQNQRTIKHITQKSYLSDTSKRRWIERILRRADRETYVSHSTLLIAIQSVDADWSNRQSLWTAGTTRTH
jgi:hypothetical protein